MHDMGPPSQPPPNPFAHKNDHEITAKNGIWGRRTPSTNKSHECTKSVPLMTRPEDQ